MRSSFSPLLIFFLAFASTLAKALPGDENQPIHIAADSASINDLTGITTYKGNVIIKQGTLLIEAAHVDMHRGDEGVDKLIAKGSPAHFRQKPDHNQPFSDAWGKHMVYKVKSRNLTITKSAKVVQGQDTFTGERIIYDLQKSIVNAYGSEQPGSNKGKGRVNMVIQPKASSKGAN